MIRVYITLAVVAALVASHWWAYGRGYSAADQTARVQSLTLQLEEANKRNAAKDRVARALREDSERTADEIETLSEQVQDYADLLATRDDGDVCRLDRDDVDRLRAIR